jgi:molecular chaperone DnaK (HSP70)
MSSPADSSEDFTTTPSFQTSSHLVIAIDFGTTFTGVAYYHSRSNLGALDAQQIAKDITVVTRWPNATGTFREKTPSIIAYNGDPPAWGRQVKPTDQPQATHFKLGLEPNTRQYYNKLDDDTTALPRNRRQRINNKEPVDIASDYLTCVYKFVRDVLFREQFGENYLQTQRTSYVITVPSIWSDYAENLTRIAATRAGIPSDSIFLITEPEAAALYCATICEEVNLRHGDRFLVCDAGGGTVVKVNSHEFLKSLGSGFLRTR